MRYSLLLAAFSGLAVTLAWAKPIELRVQRSPSEFVRNVARLCLSGPESRIEMVSTQRMRIDDEPACAANIQFLAEKWEKQGKSAGSVVGAYVGTRDKESLLLSLQARYGRIKLLGETPSCPCLVFTGPKSAEQAQLASAPELR